jgi:hypothetical protein
LKAGHRIEATFLQNEINSQYDAFTVTTADDQSLLRSQSVGMSWSAKWTDAYATRLSVGQSNDRYETIPSPYVTDTRVTSYLWHNEFRTGAHILSAALERREDKLNNASTSPRVTQRSQDALALGYGWTDGPHLLQLNARHDNDSEFGASATGSAAYAYKWAMPLVRPPCISALANTAYLPSSRKYLKTEKSVPSMNQTVTALGSFFTATTYPILLLTQAELVPVPLLGAVTATLHRRSTKASRLQRLNA